VRHRIGAACRALKIAHVTPHGLRSYFVTQARESGLSDAEIAMLIGDKTGPAIIAQTYGDVRPDHLLKQAQRIRLTVQNRPEKPAASSPESSPAAQNASESAAQLVETVLPKESLETAICATLNQLVHGSSPCRGTIF